MYAIIETGGKQLKVEAGDTIFVEKLDVEAGQKVTFDKVLLIGDKTTKIGAPYITGATVEATVEKQGKEKKVTIYKYNSKKHYHKKQGHRQPYTKLVIDSIGGKAAKVEAKEETVKAAKPAAKKPAAKKETAAKTTTTKKETTTKTAAKKPTAKKTTKKTEE